jgi:hypothetical protein
MLLKLLPAEPCDFPSGPLITPTEIDLPNGSANFSRARKGRRLMGTRIQVANAYLSEATTG